MDKTIGFIGSGRITHILLEGLRRQNQLSTSIVVSDHDGRVLEKLTSRIPEIDRLTLDNTLAAQQDLIFLAVHPPFVPDVLNEIKSFLRPESILVSLVPRFSIRKLTELLDGFNRIIRMIPNAPSIVNAGFNPICFSEGIGFDEKHETLSLFSLWGNCPEVEEKHLEAYVVLTAVGPTYFWFQWLELANLAKEFGLSDEDTVSGLFSMLSGAAKALFDSDLPSTEILDLVKIKPLKENEESILALFRSQLTDLYNRLTVEA